MEEAVDDYCKAFVLEGLKSANEVLQLEGALKASYRDEVGSSYSSNSSSSSSNGSAGGGGSRARLVLLR